MKLDLSDPEHFTVAWTRTKERWDARDERMDLIDGVMRGDWAVVGPDDEALENRSPNLLQVAMEDTAEAASLIPSIRVTPSKQSTDAKHKAEIMERLGISYFAASEIELLTILSMMRLAGHGLFSWVCVRDKNGPRIEFRDPRTCYPEADFGALGITRRAFFARDIYVSQLPGHWKDIFLTYCHENNEDVKQFQDNRITLVEYYDEEQTIVAAVYSAGRHYPTTNLTAPPAAVSVILETAENPTGLCPVVTGQRPTFDGEPRGQFDQVVPVMQAHIRLMALVMDYSDQAVYSDVWVKDLIGHMPMGGGSYIQLGPQGQIGRVPPAVSSMSVYQELNDLVGNIHVGGRWPKTRPGDIDQAIASGKFVEATSGMMNTVIRTYHLIFKRALEQALTVLYTLDGQAKDTRTVSGVLRNQKFLETVKPTDIDLGARIRVEYGLGLGRDPAQSMVLGIQANQSGFVSREFVQENFEGITDVGLERARLDAEQFRDMVMAKILQGVQDETIPDRALIEIERARRMGSDLFELYEKYVIKPQEEVESQLLTSGLDGGQMAPGAMPGPEGGAGAPTAPAAEDLMALLAGGGGGGEEPEMIGRLSTPAGGQGSFAGTTSR